MLKVFLTQLCHLYLNPARHLHTCRQIKTILQLQNKRLPLSIAQSRLGWLFKRLSFLNARKIDSLTVLVFLSLSFLAACGSMTRMLEYGKNSLIGKWVVTEVYYAEGQQGTQGLQINHSDTVSGNLGNFEFDASLVIYDYVYDQNQVQGQSLWQLNGALQNCGFVRCPVYTLVLDDVAYELAFGDQTQGSEKNATQVTLTYETKQIGPYERYTLTLQKETN